MSTLSLAGEQTFVRGPEPAPQPGPGPDRLRPRPPTARPPVAPHCGPRSSGRIAAAFPAAVPSPLHRAGILVSSGCRRRLASPGARLAPAAEHEAAEREAEAERADREGADRDRPCASRTGAASVRAPPAPRRSAARRGAACASRRRRARRDRDRRRSPRLGGLVRHCARSIACFDGVSPDPPRVRPPFRQPRGRRTRRTALARPSRARLRPELVVASGDLTHRGRRAQHERPRPSCAGSARRVLAVPGNHDIPYAPRPASPGRGREFERHWETAEPVHASAGLVRRRPELRAPLASPVAARSGDAQLERAAAASPAQARRRSASCALHHQLTGAPWRTRKRPVAHRNHVLGRARRRRRRADPLRATSTRRRWPSGTSSRLSTAAQRGVAVAIAPGLGQPRPHRRGEARGLLVHEADERRDPRRHLRLARGRLGPDRGAPVPAGRRAAGRDPGLQPPRACPQRQTLLLQPRQHRHRGHRAPSRDRPLRGQSSDTADPAPRPRDRQGRPAVPRDTRPNPAAPGAAIGRPSRPTPGTALEGGRPRAEALRRARLRASRLQGTVLGGAVVTRARAGCSRRPRRRPLPARTPPRSPWTASPSR